MKYLLVCIFSIIICSGAVKADEPQKKTICVNMIVKNESAVIRRCLGSLKSFIDFWVIVDTGSTDNTQGIIKEFMKDIPGELHERPWINFGHNRNEALELAKGKADYILIIDADELLEFAPGFVKPNLDKDFYSIMTQYGGTSYARVQLVNNHLNWRWEGVLHEYLTCDESKTSDTLLGVKNIVNTDGARSQDPQKYQKDAAILEKALEKEPNSSRYRFYLAQSYRDAGDYENAITNYKKRIDMGGWDQEIFWSMLQIGGAQEALNKDPATFLESYYLAYRYRPSRIEPLFRIANYYRRVGNYEAGYWAALEGIFKPYPTDNLFVDRWIYEYGLLLEYSICAYWTDRPLEAKFTSALLLSNTKLPIQVRDCVQNNLRFVDAKIQLLVDSKKPSLISPKMESVKNEEVVEKEQQKAAA